MIIHTIIPQELIFAANPIPQHKEKYILYQGIPIAIEHINESEVRVTKILSTNPMDYLNESVSPGKVLSLWN